MSGGAPRALSEWLRLMLAEIAAKRTDTERACNEARRRAVESAAALPHEPPPEPGAAQTRTR